MDGVIFLEDLEFFAKHGLRDSERVSAQKFLVSVCIFGNFLAATHSDNISHTIDYSMIYDLIKQIVEGNGFHLVERLAGEIAGNIFDKFSMATAVKVTVKKHPSSWVSKEYGSIGFSAKFPR
jgi:dihydroneopterin aldolase